jgi:hypothetical protein
MLFNNIQKARKFGYFFIIDMLFLNLNKLTKSET